MPVTMNGQPRDEESFDILFIGAGVSTLYTVLNLASRLCSRGAPVGHRPRIGIVERSTDGLGGVPYSGRSSYTSLLITSLRDFLPDGERALFAQWLDQNKSWMFGAFQQHGGIMSARWLRLHGDAIHAGAWEDLYLPRHLFGLYMDARIRRAMGVAESAGACTFEMIAGQVAGLARTDGGFEIDLADRTLRARSVVLAVGSPPTSTKLTPPATRLESGGEPPCLIEDPYGPDLVSSLERIDASVRHAPDPSPKILFVGASASTMDLLYALQDRWHDARSKVRFRVLSPNGRLPDRMTEHAQAPPFQPTALEALAEQPLVTAKEIHDAATSDIDLGQRHGLTTSDTLAPISTAVGTLLAHLSAGEQREFAATWGNAIGRLQRRAGPEYCDVAEELAAEGRLGLTRGRFRRIRSITAEGAEVEYEEDGIVLCLPRRPRVIVNCGGFARIGELPPNHLLQRVIASGLAQPTAAGTGIAVNEYMEASEGVFVLGPLLAGNVIAGKPVWHLEHCGRISAFAGILAEVLEDRLARGLAPKLNTFACTSPTS